MTILKYNIEDIILKSPTTLYSSIEICTRFIYCWDNLTNLTLRDYVNGFLSDLQIAYANLAKSQQLLYVSFDPIIFYMDYIYIKLKIRNILKFYLNIIS